MSKIVPKEGKMTPRELADRVAQEIAERLPLEGSSDNNKYLWARDIASHHIFAVLCAENEHCAALAERVDCEIDPETEPIEHECVTCKVAAAIRARVKP